MAEQQGQSRDTHTRIHPVFHFFFLPAILLLIGFATYEMVHEPSIVPATQLLLILVVAVEGFLSRTYALKVQERRG